MGAPGGHCTPEILDSLGTATLISWITLIFVGTLLFITAILKTPALKRQDVIERHVALSNVKTMNYLELVCGVFTC